MLAVAPIDYFFDPILRAPTIGCMLMCVTASLVGVIAFLRKQSLLGESLSHASYPGVILAVITLSAFPTSFDSESWVSLFILSGAFLSALLGLLAINLLEKKLNVRHDAALCFVLSSFFGIGLTLASRVQSTATNLYQKINMYLYGQAATMTDGHIILYATLSLISISAIFAFYKEIQVINFDKSYAESTGIKTKLVDTIFFLLIVLAIIIGIRSVGVVLMSAMLIAPAAAARQYSNKLYIVFALAAIFGASSGFLGNYLSVELSDSLADRYPDWRSSLPTGPSIVIVASLICLFSLFFAPDRGLFWRLFRRLFFRYSCALENVLKTIWRFADKEGVSSEDIARYVGYSRFTTRFILWRLSRQGYVQHNSPYHVSLKAEGLQRAEHIVRLHRLWEVYLVDYLGVGVERVHRNAEEMEHIITPELEQELTELLKDPLYDPHKQPIPRGSST